FEPLAAIYSKSCLEVFQRRLARRHFSLQSAIHELIERADMSAHDVPAAEASLFDNLHTPEDLAYFLQLKRWRSIELRDGNECAGEIDRALAVVVNEHLQGKPGFAFADELTAKNIEFGLARQRADGADVAANGATERDGAVADDDV